MLELFIQAARGNPEALGGVASLVSVIAIIPAAAIFITNQVLQNAQLRQDKYRYLNDKYTEYLTLTLQFPAHDIEHGAGFDINKLSKDERCQLFVLYEMFTAMVEAAFQAYRNSWTSSRQTQWQGWIDYLDRYMRRPDYRAFLSLVLFRKDLDEELREGRLNQVVGLSEYDTEFERFLLARYERFLLADREKTLTATN